MHPAAPVVGMSPVVEASVWALALILLSAALVAALYYLRRWMIGGQGAQDPGGLTLSELRQMAQTGVISTEEFQRARDAAIRAAQAAGRERSSAPAVDSGVRNWHTPLSQTGGTPEENHGGSGRAPPADRLPERKPRPDPLGGQESGQPDR